MKITDKKYILFDLDGTITDSAPGIVASAKYALSKFGIYENDISVLQKFVGPPLVNAFTEIYGFSREKSIQAVKYYREYYPDYGIFECTVYDGIRCVFEGLKKQGKQIILATAKPELYTQRILDHFDLAKYFDLVAGSDFENTRTEKEEIIAYALKQAKIENTSDCIMVGDRYYDIKGAHVNNIEAIGVLYGYGSKEELNALGAEYLVNTVHDLGKLLGVEICSEEV